MDRNNPIIFLDFDGVINSRRFFAGVPREQWLRHKFDPTLLRNVGWLATRMAADIVVTSTWRHEYSDIGTLRDRVASYENGARVAEHIIDRTPHIGRRGREIEAWMNDAMRPERYVILDDVKYQLRKEQKKHLVLCDRRFGFCGDDLELAVQILSRERMARE